MSSASGSVCRVKTNQLTVCHQGDDSMRRPAVVGRCALIGYNSKQRDWSVRGEPEGSTKDEDPQLEAQNKGAASVKRLGGVSPLRS